MDYRAIIDGLLIGRLFRGLVSMGDAVAVPEQAGVAET